MQLLFFSTIEKLLSCKTEMIMNLSMQLLNTLYILCIQTIQSARYTGIFQLFKVYLFSLQSKQRQLLKFYKKY